MCFLCPHAKEEVLLNEIELASADAISGKIKGYVGEIKGQCRQDQRGRTRTKFGYKLIELLTHLQVWDSLMLAPIII